MKCGLLPIVVMVSGAMALTACAAPAPAPAATASGSARIARPASTARPAAARIKDLGVFEPASPQSYGQVETFARVVGRQPDIVLYYSGWGESFRSSFARTAHSHGATVFVDMDPDSVSVAGIAAGDTDNYLKNIAHQVRNFGHNVIISFGHEPNGPWYSWGYTHTKAATWVRAWRHIVTVFRAAGARNVTWLWIVNTPVPGKSEGPIRDWWPGSSYVTWAGMDGYYERTSDTFPAVFDTTISGIRKLTAKPILISETAIGQLSGKVAKMPGLFAGVRARHLLGLVWFDMAQDQGSHHQDWRLEGNAPAIAAFRRGLRSRSPASG